MHNGGLTLCHYETKVKDLKLSWMKGFTSEKDSTWKILPKLFINARNLTTVLMLIINFYLTQIFLPST